VSDWEEYLSNHVKMKQKRRLLLGLWLVLILVIGTVFWANQVPDPIYQGRRLNAWLDDLNSSNPLVHDQAIEVVRQFGPKGIPVLIRAVQARDSWLRSKIEELAQQQTIVHFHLADTAARRRAACMALRALGPTAQAAIPALTNLLLDAHADQSADAAWALERVGIADKDAVIPAFLESLSMSPAQISFLDSPGSFSDVPFSRSGVVPVRKFLSQCASQVVLPLTKMLTNDFVIARLNAASVLADLGPAAKAAVPALLKRLDDEDANVSSGAANALANLGPLASETVPALVKALDNIFARTGAANALKNTTSDAKGFAVPMLLKALANDEASDDRWTDHARKVAEVLVAIDPEQGPKIVSVLMNLLSKTNIADRPAVASMLGQMGRGARTALPALAAALKVEKHGLRHAAAVAIWKVGSDDRAIEDAAMLALIESLKPESDILERLTAVDLLGQTGSRANEVFPALLPLLKDENPRIRCAAAAAISKTGMADKAVERQMLAAVTDVLKGWVSLTLEHHEAVVTLGKIGASAREAIPDLIKILKGADNFLRLSAALAILKIGGAGQETLQAALFELIDSLKPGHQTAARWNAAVYLEELGPRASGAVPALVEMINEETGSFTLRTRAIEALRNIDPTALRSSAP
jgi:HEAT repeat protein